MSAKFLKMPASSQSLYFHLGLNADDDGVVEAFSIMRIIGCAADDLKILIAKGFIIQLNEDEVCFIVDWLEHNQIRADRKVNSIYHDLLTQTIGNVKLIEAKPRADRQPKVSSGTSQGQPMGGIGKDSIGKDSIGKDSIGKDKTNATKVAGDISELFNYWKETHQSPRSKLDDKRKKLIKSALGLYSVEDLRLAILGCSYSGFHMGKEPKTNGKQHNGIDLILRDADHIDSFIKMAETNKPVQPLQLMKIIYNDYIDKFVVYQYMPEAGGDLYCGESIPLDEIDNNPNIYKIIQDDRNK